MTNAWYNPHHQQDIPSTPGNPSAAGPGQITAQPNVDNPIQGCHCPICSRAGYNHQTNQPERTTEYQNPWAPIEPMVPYANQTFGGGGYSSDITATVGGQSQAWPSAPQAPGIQENAGWAPQEAVTPSSFEIQTGAAPDQAQVLDTSATEWLRRLARRYVDDPESLVSGLHLEPGAYGQAQVVITIEIGDIFGDIIN